MVALQKPREGDELCTHESSYSGLEFPGENRILVKMPKQVGLRQLYQTAWAGGRSGACKGPTACSSYPRRLRPVRARRQRARASQGNFLRRKLGSGVLQSSMRT